MRIDRPPPDWIDRFREHEALTDVCLGKDDSSGFSHWYSASLLALWGQEDLQAATRTESCSATLPSQAEYPTVVSRPLTWNWSFPSGRYQGTGMDETYLDGDGYTMKRTDYVSSLLVMLILSLGNLARFIEIDLGQTIIVRINLRNSTIGKGDIRFK